MDALYGWVRPGPVPPGGLAPEPGETLDALCGHWKIFQYAGGHRYSLDDLLTAWFGTTWCPRPGRIADLGSGIGSVALVAAWRCPGAEVHTVEAEPLSVRLAEKSARFNGVSPRFHVHAGDLRDPAVLAGEAPFDLVLGSPPYWPQGSHQPARHPQTRPARFELRGGVEDYARAARRLLAPGGLFACVMELEQAARALAAFREARLAPLHRQDVRFKAGEAAGVILLAGGRPEDLPAELADPEKWPRSSSPLTVRDEAGRVAPDFARVRLTLGFPPGRLGGAG